MDAELGLWMLAVLTRATVLQVTAVTENSAALLPKLAGKLASA